MSNFQFWKIKFWKSKIFPSVWSENCLCFPKKLPRHSSGNRAAAAWKTVRYVIFLLYCPAVFGHFSPAPVKTDRAVRIFTDFWLARFTIKVYAWLIDSIHRRKNCPTEMISGWVQKVTEHHGTIQYTYQRKGDEMKQRLARNSGKSHSQSYRPISVFCHALLIMGTALFHAKRCFISPAFLWTKV